MKLKFVAKDGKEYEVYFRVEDKIQFKYKEDSVYSWLPLRVNNLSGIIENYKKYYDLYIID